MSSKIWIGLGVVAVVGLAAIGYAALSRQGTPVETAVVQRGAIREFVEEQGKTRLPREYEITMPFAARIDAITIREGNRVEAGQVVAQLNEFDLANDVATAQAAVDRLAAAVRESGDKSVELTGYEQVQSYVESMNLTVAAADEQRKSTQKKLDVAQAHFNRIKAAYADNPQALTQDAYEQAEVALVDAEVNHTQNELIYQALVAIQSATNLLPTVVQQYIARKDLTKAIREEEQAEAEVRLAMAEERQERGTLKSPVSGVVLKREIVNEQFLPAGQLLLTIGQLDELEIEADVLSQDVVDVQEGDSVELFGPTIGKTPVHGAVSRIYPAGFTKVSSLGVEQQRVKVVVGLDAAETASLRERRQMGVGYQVRARIFTDEKADALTIPRSAVFRSVAGTWQVFVVRDGTAVLQAVEVGLMNDESVEVVEGLAEGEQVVIAPETTLTDGTRVDVSR